MAQIGGHYNQDAEPTGEFERLPAGDYRAKIVESEIVDISDTKDIGRCLKLTWQVETGPLDGRLFWQRLNMWFTGPEKTPGKVAEIANQQFAAIRHATGKLAVNDTEELHHIPCMVSYGPQKNNPEYDEVKSVKPIAGARPVQQSGPQPSGPPRSTPPASQKANSGGSAPWRRAG